MSKFQMTDSKITHNQKTGRVSLSFYSNTDDEELNLLLALMGAYNSHGRQFDLDKFEALEERFNSIIEQAGDILK
tara:strand:- start:819 stop:1043 length:225 start_codon:yes stop_codon:yes gene_type:complete